MTLIDYDNRRYDFLALQNTPLTNADTQLELALLSSNQPGQICVGIQKLTQRWLLEFLTETGSMPGMPTRGTNFMTLVGRGRLRTEAALISAFNFAAYTARTNMTKDEDTTWPNDERIGKAELYSMTFTPGAVDIGIVIVSRAGTDRAIILPVQTLLKNLT